MLSRRQALLLLVSLSLCGGCSGQPLERDQGFERVLVRDGSRAVFSVRDGRLRRRQGDFWGPGFAEFVSVDRAIVEYDFDTHEGRVLWREDSEQRAHNRGQMALVSLQGDQLFVSCEALKLDGQEVVSGHSHLVDLARGEARPVPWIQELAALGLEAEHSPQVVHPDGVLLYRAVSAVASGRFLLRQPDGHVLDVGEGSLSGVLDGKLYIRRPRAPGRDEIDVRTGEVRALTNAEYSKVSPRIHAGQPAAASVRSNGTQIEFRSAAPGSAPLQLDLEDVLDLLD